MSDKDIKFFSEVDMTKTKDVQKIGSEYPIWYFDRVIEEIEENIRMDERLIENEAMTAARRLEIRERLKRHKTRLDQIKQGLPELTDAQKDTLAKARKSLGEKIRDNMSKRSDEKKGLVDSHQELKKWTQPFIPLQNDEYRLALECNVPVRDGKVTRKQAEKIWKIVSKRLGEVSNTEYLRKD